MDDENKDAISASVVRLFKANQLLKAFDLFYIINIYSFFSRSLIGAMLIALAHEMTHTSA